MKKITMIEPFQKSKLSVTISNHFDMRLNLDGIISKGNVIGNHQSVIATNDRVISSEERVLLSEDCVLLAEDRVLLKEDRVLPSEERVWVSKERVFCSNIRVDVCKSQNNRLLYQFKQMITLKN